MIISHNIIMKIFLLCFFIVLLLVLIIVLPFKIKAGLHINYLNMEAYYIISFLFLNVICGKLTLNDKGIVFENKSNHLFKNSNDGDEYSKYTIQEYINRLKIVNINFYKCYGDEDNAMNTALIVGFDYVLYDTIRSILETSQTEINCYNEVRPEFCNSRNMTSVYAVIKISILDVIISNIKAKLKSKKIKFKEKKSG